MLRGSRGLTASEGSTSAPGNTMLPGDPPAVQPGTGLGPDTATGPRTNPGLVCAAAAGAVVTTRQSAAPAARAPRNRLGIGTVLPRPGTSPQDAQAPHQPVRPSRAPPAARRIASWPQSANSGELLTLCP